MSSRHLLLLCIVSALQEPKVVNGINVFAGTEGRSGGMSCYLPLSGNRKFKYFCKDSCEGSNILLKTDGVMATNGAYSLRYEIGTGSHSGRGILHVSITNLTMADSGRYICALGSAQVALSELQFEVIITDVLPRTDNLLIQAASEGGNVTIPCHGTNFTRGSKRFFCRNKCEKEEDVLIETEEAKAARGRHSIEYREMSTFGFYITITDLNTSDQGWYACGYGSALSPDWVAFIPVVVIAAPVKTTPSWTTFPTSSPSTSTARPTTTTTHILTSERFATFPATTPPTTAPVTTTPTWTTFPTSSPSTSTPMPTTTHILPSERFAPFPATTPPTTGRPLLPLMCLPALGVLLPAVGLVLLNRWKKDRNSRQTTNMSDTEMSAVYNKHISVPVCDSTRD